MNKAKREKISFLLRRRAAALRSASKDYNAIQKLEGRDRPHELSVRLHEQLDKITERHSYPQGLGGTGWSVSGVVTQMGYEVHRAVRAYESRLRHHFARKSK